MPTEDCNATVYINTGLGARGPPLELFSAKSKAGHPVCAETKAGNCHVKEQKADHLIPREIRNNFKYSINIYNIFRRKHELVSYFYNLKQINYELLEIELDFIIIRK